MRLRLIAVSLILVVSAWLPIIAQQSSTSQPSAKPDQPAATCCHGKDGNPQSMPRCEGKDAKDMACCKKDARDKQATATCCDAKDGKSYCRDAKQSAAKCCKGKDAKLCTKNGKDCCAGPDRQSCCDKNAAPTSAANLNAKTCCAAEDHSCCHSKSNA
jgi:hypothetical protein